LLEIQTKTEDSDGIESGNEIAKLKPSNIRTKNNPKHQKWSLDSFLFRDFTALFSGKKQPVSGA